MTLVHEMKRISIVCVVVLLVVSATLGAGDKAWFQKLVTEWYTPAVRATLMPEAKARSEKSLESDDEQWQYIYSFFRGYLHALENTPGTMHVGHPGGPHQTGFDAGMDYFRQLNSATNQPFGLVDFGYAPVVTNGTYKWAFEQSDFQPDGSEENWWTQFQVGVVANFSQIHGENERSLFSLRRDCILKGYLSPDNIGFTGHFNQYDRDFIVTEIVEVGPAPKPMPTQEIEITIQEGPTTKSTLSSEAAPSAPPAER